MMRARPRCGRGRALCAVESERVAAPGSSRGANQATGLSGRGPIRNSGTAAKRGIAEGRLPVPGGDELGTIEELGAIQERSGKIGAVEHRFEEVRPLHSSTRQVRIAALRAPQIGAAKVGPRKIESTEIEAAQCGRRQVRRLVVRCPPRIPCRGAASEQGDMLISGHYRKPSGRIVPLSQCARSS
jgi:hypothetical protein